MDLQQKSLYTLPRRFNMHWSRTQAFRKTLSSPSFTFWILRLAFAAAEKNLFHVLAYWISTSPSTTASRWILKTASASTSRPRERSIMSTATSSPPHPRCLSNPSKVLLPLNRPVLRLPRLGRSAILGSWRRSSTAVNSRTLPTWSILRRWA